MDTLIPDLRLPAAISAICPRRRAPSGRLRVWLFWLARLRSDCPTSPIAAIARFVLLFAGGCWIAGRAERILVQHDSSRIVIDEILGMVAAMFMLPTRWPWMLAAFGLFRLFDILKPYPASLIDRQVHGGVGVMLDDLVLLAPTWPAYCIRW